MMNGDRVLQYLKTIHPQGADDDQITAAIGLKRRQDANRICHHLEREGKVARQHGHGKIRTFWLAHKQPAIPPEAVGPVSKIHGKGSAEVFEDQVKRAVKEYLESTGCEVKSVAWGREPGRDIEAVRDGKPLWVTAKGYPSGTAKTRASTQAEHYFKEAIFDVVAWRTESMEADIAVALPDRLTYRKLGQKTRWLQEHACFNFLWVDDKNGVVFERLL